MYLALFVKFSRCEISCRSGLPWMIFSFFVLGDSSNSSPFAFLRLLGMAPMELEKIMHLGIIFMWVSSRTWYLVDMYENKPMKSACRSLAENCCFRFVSNPTFFHLTSLVHKKKKIPNLKKNKTKRWVFFFYFATLYFIAELRSTGNHRQFRFCEQ